MCRTSDFPRRVRQIAWFFGVCSWLVQALAARHTLDADGISYLNIVTASLRGNWHALANGYWSPGYPFLLTLWFRLFHPDPYFVPLAVRFFGVLSLIVALAAFEYFLSVFFSTRHKLIGDDEEHGAFLSDTSIRVAGYALFLWITVFFTPAYLDHPDIEVFSLYLVASATCLRLASSPTPEWWRFLFLGIVLGFAYLVKAVMFPLSFAFLASLLFNRGVRQSFLKLVLAGVVFLLVGLPLILALSKSKARLTYGDAGAVNYQQMVGEPDEPAPVQAESQNAESLQELAAAPHLGDYRNILNLGTYPPWADPSFNFKNNLHGIRLRRQLNRIHVDLKVYFDVFVVQLGCLLCGLLVLIFYAGNPFAYVSRFLAQTALWLPAVSGLALYALVRVELRFLAGFTVALFAAGVAALRFENEHQSKKVENSAVTTTAILLVAQIALQVGHDGLRLLVPDRYAIWQVAQALDKMGVKAGDRVSYMGDALTDHAWAFLAGVSIAGEIPQEDVAKFWAASPEQKQQAISLLAAAGAKVLVTSNVPSPQLSAGWKRVGDTGYYILELSKETVRESSPPTGPP